ncbi:MAG: adenylyltransferase/cytidyltransferase family protein [Lachnospiraceae bacterium]|nr:adenylyltransferase/cytidyltransferase family protein [Lachnospiraceae bacterium]
MKKVITYGTYDLLHHGHIRLLERAKALGDYLIVGVTADDFDKVRGKINVQQSLMERIEGVRATGLADEIIVEEYEGQKIDDIRRFGVDIFTVGSDWVGKFDYLNEYCQVVYLSRTKGVSSSDERARKRAIRLGLVGETNILSKYKNECAFVNGLQATGIYTTDPKLLKMEKPSLFTGSYEELLEQSDAVYLVSHPDVHYEQIKKALLAGKHVLCESPIALTKKQCRELFALADKQRLILMEAVKTAYSTAYNRLLLLIKSGQIGKLVCINAVCTSLASDKGTQLDARWNSICAWGPTAMLPIFQLCGVDYSEKSMISCVKDKHFDIFTKIDFLYPEAVATLKVGNGVKSEGELVISGTKGYLYVPAPWWKTDYFEIRYENPTENKRYFYHLEGEGIRYELVHFARSIEAGQPSQYIDRAVSETISAVIEDFYNNKDLRHLSI